jgi:hypothetical protein
MQSRLSLAYGLLVRKNANVVGVAQRSLIVFNKYCASRGVNAHVEFKEPLIEWGQLWAYGRVNVHVD